MLSSEMLKYKFSFLGWVGGYVGDGGGGVESQLLMLSLKMLKFQIPISGVGGSVGGRGD